MTPEQKAEKYVNKFFMSYPLKEIAKAAHLAGQQASWEWIPVEDGLPPLIDGEDYSENYFVMCDGIMGVMALTRQRNDDTDGYYLAWANCYGDINGDPEYDDDYYTTHYMPIPKPLSQDKPI